jgi:serine O-acetyltransferase
MPSSAAQSARLATLDPIWGQLREEADAMASAEPTMASLAHAAILRHSALEEALAARMAHKLGDAEVLPMALRDLAAEAFEADPRIGRAARADLVAIRERDPACTRYVEPLLFFKGFQAVTAQRVAHWLWRQGRKDAALFIQMRASELFSVDIHPNARLGQGLMIDHAHGVVIGETAVVGDDVSLLHAVTLGGTGKDEGDRHPKVSDGVLIGAGAKILGNIRVGECSRVAAGSVVLADVPAHATVAGVPAKVVGDAGCANPARAMDHILHGPDTHDIVPEC